MDFEERMEKLLGLRFLRGVPMREYTSFKIGGPARYLVYPLNLEEMKKVLEEAYAEKIKTFIMGYGTNLLVKDGGINGCVISTKKGFQNIEVWEEDQHVCVLGESGVSLTRVVEEVSKRGGEGIEVLAGIPGSLGGAVKMNAGTSSGSISDFVRSITVLDERLREKEVKREDLNFGYRKLSIPRRWFIWEVFLKFKKGSPEEVKKKVEEIMDYRMKTQPHGQPSAGCIFKNPPGFTAGKLLDELGLKGLRVRGAKVSNVHANFIVNVGNATAKDVLAVIDAIRKKVREEIGVSLELEVEVIGEE